MSLFVTACRGSRGSGSFVKIQPCSWIRSAPISQFVTVCSPEVPIFCLSRPLTCASRTCWDALPVPPIDSQAWSAPPTVTKTAVKANHAIAQRSVSTPVAMFTRAR